MGQLAGGEGRGKGSSEETRGGGRADGREEQGEGGEGKHGLSAFDVKSLRQKHSRAECCSTCAGSPRCQRQLGDGEDEGGEMKTGTQEIKWESHRKTRRWGHKRGGRENGNLTER